VQFNRRKSSPEKAEHRLGFIAVGVLPDKVTTRLRKELMKTFGKKKTSLLVILEQFGATRNRQWLKQITAMVFGTLSQVIERFRIQRSGQLSADV